MDENETSQPQEENAVPEPQAAAPRAEWLEPDPEVERRLQEAGFSPEQAQLVYDLAEEYLGPVVGEMRARAEGEQHRQRLVEHFGGEAKWNETVRQIRSWARANLPDPVVDALAVSYDGVMTLHKLMQAGGEPSLGRTGAPREEALSEAELKQAMKDPRYWRDRDPAVIARIEAGFKRLYPGK
ncbi:hypothetical protein [Telmatospirillum sp. J64-1]|uniref:capsid assembly protein n=1 Tax=Telmatospirillum sp. J64-1 TaxID=2502183 RepID=UPI00115C6558|nr:hypothetical protein [Telmatospirillum sp. J64-1]